MICYLCQTPQETRPYGENGQDICFPCMKASPEREATAQKNFSALLGANEVLGEGITMIGGEEGPVPFRRKGQS